jgi:hypothetical protein
MSLIAPYYKAFTGAIVAFLTAIITALDSDGISAQEWITAVIALLVSGGAVFAIPNIRSNYPPQPSETPGVTESSIQQ